MASPAVSSEEEQATVAELAIAMSLVIAAMPGTEVGAQIATEVRLESVLPVAVKLARAIDLAAREIGAPEIELAVATWEAVLGIEAASEMVGDTAAAVRVQAAIGGPPAWAVRVGGASVERAVEVAAVVAVAGDSQVLMELSQTRS